jgi:predicted Zn-dependent protease
MKHLRLFLMSIAAALLVSCGTTKTVPITGRHQSLMVSDDQVLSLSFQQYSEYMQSAKPSTNSTNTAMVKRVGQRIASAVESYLTQNGMAEEVKTYQWEFNLVQDKQVNAWCMPGGKIVVYEGLLPVTQDEASLAIVMGHEIAHAVARHSAERLSNAYKEQYGAAALSALMQGAGVSSGWQQLAGLVHQYGGALFTSGFSRKQESEADHIGLIFAAMAGYNPEVAVTFWQRMSSATGGGSNSLFADHPSDATRIQQIQGWLPEAQKYYVPPKTTTKKTTTKKTTTKKTTTKKKK